MIKRQSTIAPTPTIAATPSVVVVGTLLVALFAGIVVVNIAEKAED